MSEELKPCPFCGKKRITTETDIHPSGIYAYCTYCHCRGPLTDDAPSAIEAWNARVQKTVERKT